MKIPFISHSLWSIKVFLTNLWKNDSGKFIYVALGDSTVEGIGAINPSRSYTGIIFTSLQQHYKNATYHNLGKSGAPIHEIITAQLDKTIALNPNLITISIGANDIRLRTNVSQFKKDLKHLINTLQAETSAQIVINNIPDFSNTKVVPNHLKTISRIMILRFNEAIDQIAEKTGIIYIDLHTQSKIYTKFYPETISQDDFHPSDFGYALWANTIITSIKHIISPKVAKFP